MDIAGEAKALVRPEMGIAGVAKCVEMSVVRPGIDIVEVEMFSVK